MKLKMYGELAPWFHLLTAPKDYADTGRTIVALMEQLSRHPVREVLELGSGGGNHASHLKGRYALTLVDLSEDMLSLSKSINPECEHVLGDMRSARLGRTFDAVYIHDAISYMRTEADLAAAIQTAAAHVRLGGACVFMPDDVKETYTPSHSSGGHDGDDGRAVRYLQWDHPPRETTHDTTFVYILHEPNKPVRVEHETHTFGYFSRATWLRLIAEAGLSPARHQARWSDEAQAYDVFTGLFTPKRTE